MIARLLGHIAVCLLLAFCGCRKKVQLKEDVAATVDTSKQLDTERHAEIDKATTESISKTTGPVEKHESKVTKLFDWVPPPPGAPKGAAPQWLPKKEIVEEKDTKIAPSTTEKQIGGIEHSSAGGTTVQLDKGHTSITGKKDETTETDIGLSWQVKWAIAVGAVLVALGAIAYFKPSLLGVPARAIKWLLSHFKTPEVKP